MTKAVEHIRQFREEQKRLHPRITTPMEFAIHKNDQLLLRRLLHKEVLWLVYNYLNSTEQWCGCNYNKILSSIKKLTVRLPEYERLIVDDAKLTADLESIIINYFTTRRIIEPSVQENEFFPASKELPIELRNLASYIEPLKKWCLLFSLHGSYATKDVIPGWSDVDTLCIVKGSTLTNRRHLQELRKYITRLLKQFFKVDPFQLHGFFITTEFDLESYDETQFPLYLFNHSTIVFAPTKVKFTCRDNKADRLSVFWYDSVNYFTKLVSEPNAIESLNAQKIFLHRVFSIPIFYFQALGTALYKPDAFKNMFTDYNDQELAAIKFFSERMFKFKYDFRMNNVLLNLPLPQYYFLKNRYYNFFHPRIFFKEDITFERMIDLANFSIKLWERVIRNIEYVHCKQIHKH